MNDGFAVDLNLSSRFLRITTFGLWSQAVARAFGRDVDAALLRYHDSGGEHGTLLSLLDLRESTIQSRETTTNLQGTTDRFVAASLRIAVLHAQSAIQRAQAKRLLTADKHRPFWTEHEALAWLNDARQSFSMAG